MDERRFIEEKKPGWERLSQSIERARKVGLSSLSREELKSLGELYRSVVSDLSFARTQGASDNLVLYLNQLSGQAHGMLFSAPRAGVRGISTFILRDFPRLFRSTLWYSVVSALVFIIGGVVASYIISTHPYLSAEWMPPDITDPASASSFIMVNNIKVGIFAFASGMTAGVLTIFILFRNGMMIGTIATSLSPQEQWGLWTFVAPHGVIELTAIFICGGAGLLIGAAFIAPGNMRRSDAIRIAAGKAVKLFAGTIAFFVMAGIIEGFLSPSALPGWFKLIFSGITVLGLICYLGFAGRE